MSTISDYFEFLQKKLDEVSRQAAALESAAGLIVDSCAQGGRFYVFGSGHSHMVAEELYLRAGGLAWVRAILPPELMLHEMANKSTYLERLSGYAEAILTLYEVGGADTLMVISNSGRNAVPVEMCLGAKARGAHVIAMTSMQHTVQCASRHSCGKNIYQLADVVLDNCGEKGDAAFLVEGVDTPIGPTSSVTGTALAQALIVEVTAQLARRHLNPPVFKSSNVDGADAYNEALFSAHYGYRK